jgi:hypothetical protein
VTLSNLTGVLLALALAVPAGAQTPSPAGDATFIVFYRSQPVGREEAVVVRTADEWVVRGSSRLGQPIDITSRTAQIIYDLEWRPKSLTIDAVVRGQDISLQTTFDGKQASNLIAVQGKPQ